MSKIDDRKQIVKRLHQINGRLDALSVELSDIGLQIDKYSEQLREHPRYTNELLQLKNDCLETLNRIAISRYWSQLKNKTEKILCILRVYDKGLHQADVTRIYTEMQKSANKQDQRHRMISLLFLLKKQGRLETTTYSPRNIIYRLKSRDESLVNRG